MTERDDSPRQGQTTKIHLATLLVTIGLTVCGGMVSWGVQQTRLSVVEHSVDDQKTEQQQIRNQLAEQATKIAVTSAEYTEIIRRLDSIDNRLVVASQRTYETDRRP